MKRHHKVLIGAGLVVTLAAWLAWMVLLTDAETEEPVESGSVAAPAHPA